MIEERVYVCSLTVLNVHFSPESAELYHGAMYRSSQRRLHCFDWLCRHKQELYLCVTPGPDPRDRRFSNGCLFQQAAGAEGNTGAIVWPRESQSSPQSWNIRAQAAKRRQGTSLACRCFRVKNEGSS